MCIRDRYWADPFAGKKNLRANLDGSQVEDLARGLGVQVGIALDVDRERMYWADSETDKVQSSGLDGTNVRDVISGGGAPRCIVLHLEEQKMYWTGLGTHTIYRANLDGGCVETILAAYNHPCGLALVVD